MRKASGREVKRMKKRKIRSKVALGVVALAAATCVLAACSPKAMANETGRYVVTAGQYY